MEHALHGVLAEGYRTEDMINTRDRMKVVSCREMGDLLLEELENFEVHLERLLRFHMFRCSFIK